MTHQSAPRAMRARLLCRLFGHRMVTWMLPEEDYGLYAFSKIQCGRCRWVEVENPPEAIAAAYHFWERDAR